MSSSKHIMMGLALAKIEFWAERYQFSFQFWGKDNNNCFIYRDHVELKSMGGCGSAEEILNIVIAWCEKANPRKKYPPSLEVINPQP